MYVCETRSQFALQQFYVRVSLQYYTYIEEGAFVYSTIYSMWCIYIKRDLVKAIALYIIHTTNERVKRNYNNMFYRHICVL